MILLDTEIDLERNSVRHVAKSTLEQNQLECHRGCFRSLSPSRGIIGDRTSCLRGSSRTEIANQRRDRPRGKTWQRGKAPHRRGSPVYADLNANSLVWRAFFPHPCPILRSGRSTRSHTTKLIARCGNRNVLLLKREDENAIERDRNPRGSSFAVLSCCRFSCFRESYLYAYFGRCRC